MRISEVKRSLGTGLFLALRGILRSNKTVQILTMSMLLLVFLNLLIPKALLQGLINTVNTKLITLMTSDLVVEPPSGYKQFDDPEAIERAISQLEGVESVTSQMRIATEISAGGYSTTFGSLIVDPEPYGQVFDTAGYLSEGSFLTPDDMHQIVLGIQVAGSDDTGLDLYATSLRSVHAGDTVMVTFPNAVTEEFTVKGIINSDFTYGDTRSFISRQDYERIDPRAIGRANLINVKLVPGFDQGKVLLEIEQLGMGLSVTPWQSQAGVLRSVTRTFEVVITILQAIALIVGSITIYIVTYVDLNNKRKQIGIQRAIGITPFALTFSYIIRAVLYSLIGNLFGMIVFLKVLIPWEHQHPFKLPFGYVFLEVDRQYLLGVFGVLFIVAVISSAYPTWRTIKVRILDAIWGT